MEIITQISSQMNPLALIASSEEERIDEQLCTIQSGKDAAETLTKLS